MYIGVVDSSVLLPRGAEASSAPSVCVSVRCERVCFWVDTFVTFTTHVIFMFSHVRYVHNTGTLHL